MSMQKRTANKIAKEPFVASPRLISGEPGVEETQTEFSLRPRLLYEYIGQNVIKENLKIAIEAAKQRNDAPDHILLHGPPGLGKTTLANIIANELEVKITSTAGPAIERAGDLAAILTNLGEKDILFIDEIHRLNRVVEETLYPALEDFKLDIIIGEGPSARTLKIDIPKFTLVGATTRAALLTSPLRDRFGIVHRLDFYNVEELVQIVVRAADVMSISITNTAADEIARRARGTPRVATRLLKRVRDFAQVRDDGSITFENTKKSLDMLEIDELGLEKMDRKILSTIIEKFCGGPVGLDALSAMISEEQETINDVYEPYLVKLGFVQRTPRGRIATRDAYKHLKLPTPAEQEKQISLWNE